jgi:hypothetical protein
MDWDAKKLRVLYTKSFFFFSNFIIMVEVPHTRFVTFLDTQVQ